MYIGRTLVYVLCKTLVLELVILTAHSRKPHNACKVSHEKAKRPHMIRAGNNLFCLMGQVSDFFQFWSHIHQELSDISSCMHVKLSALHLLHQVLSGRDVWVNPSVNGHNPVLSGQCPKSGCYIQLCLMVVKCWYHLCVWRLKHGKRLPVVKYRAPSFVEQNLGKFYMTASLDSHAIISEGGRVIPKLTAHNKTIRSIKWFMTHCTPLVVDKDLQSTVSLVGATHQPYPFIYTTHGRNDFSHRHKQSSLLITTP